MAVSKVVEISASQVASRRMALIAASAFLLAAVQAQAQQAQVAQDHGWRDHQGQERQGGD